MKSKEQSKIKTGGLMALLLFGLFAVCVLSVLLTGADVYQRLNARGRETYEMRTAAQYLTTKVRQADQNGWLDVTAFQGLDALTITEEIDGTEYRTWIYYHDGYLRELFAAADSELMPEDGEKILAVEGMKIRMEEDGIEAEITGSDGSTQELFLYPRSGKEVIR